MRINPDLMGHRESSIAKFLNGFVVFLILLAVSSIMIVPAIISYLGLPDWLGSSAMLVITLLTVGELCLLIVFVVCIEWAIEYLARIERNTHDLPLLFQDQGEKKEN